MSVLDKTNQIPSFDNITNQIWRKRLLSIEDGPKFWVEIESVSNLLMEPTIEIKIPSIEDDSLRFLLDWFRSDKKNNVTISEHHFLNSDVADIVFKWSLFDSYIQEIYHESVYDTDTGRQKIGGVTIRLRYNYALLT